MSYTQCTQLTRFRTYKIALPTETKLRRGGGLRQINLPPSPFTGQIQNKPTFRVWCLYRYWSMLFPLPPPPPHKAAWRNTPLYCDSVPSSPMQGAGGGGRGAPFQDFPGFLTNRLIQLLWGVERYITSSTCGCLEGRRVGYMIICMGGTEHSQQQTYRAAADREK